MPIDAPANGPVWSVRTPRVMASSVTPGPVSSGAAGSTPASAPAALDGVSDAGVVSADSSLLDEQAATGTTAAANTARSRRATGRVDIGVLLSGTDVRKGGRGSRGAGGEGRFEVGRRTG